MQETLRILSDSVPREALQLLTLLAARLFPLVVFSPLFGGENAPRRYRVGVSLVLATLYLPHFWGEWPGMVSNTLFLGLLAKEALIGLSLAVTLRLLFELVAAAGAFMDLARGATIANVLDPQTRQQGSVLSVFFLNLFLALFFSLGGHRILFEALTSSYEAIPPWGVLPPDMLGTGAALELIELLLDLFLVAFQMAAPVIAVMFVTDVTMGMLNQASPKIQAFFLAMTVKATLGLLILLLTFGIIVDAFLEHVLEGIARWVEGF